MDREIADETLRRMLRFVDPEWEMREATPAEGGFCPVYHVVVDADGTSRELVLKAPPDDDEWGVSAEARLCALLSRQTSIPVPAVIGAVDDHPDVPSPFYVMERMPGGEIPYERVGLVSDSVLRSTVRQLGAYLGELHQLDVVDSFGHVGHSESERFDGTAPTGTPAELTVIEGCDSWQAYLEAWVEEELERNSDPRFAPLMPRIRSWCRERIAAFTESFTPVLCRNDHGYHNLLVDPDTGDVTAMIDWAYTLAAPPEFDLQYAEHLFGAAYLSPVPGASDRRDLVRDALLTGYRSTAPDLADAASTSRPLYDMLTTVRIMSGMEAWDPEHLNGAEDAVVEKLKDDAERLMTDSE